MIKVSQVKSYHIIRWKLEIFVELDWNLIDRFQFIFHFPIKLHLDKVIENILLHLLLYPKVIII
jgi:hypothetical protein